MTFPVRHVYEVYIRTTPEKLWQALTDGTMTKRTVRGWPMVLSGIKTLLETGTPLRIEMPEEAATA